MNKLVHALLVFALMMLADNALAQDEASCTKVANRLIILLNAGDYSGVESLFNKDMSKALPLDKARTFFTGLAAQAGKIQKLDDPKQAAGWTVFPAHFERGLMDMSLVLDREEKIAGINFKPRAVSPQSPQKKQPVMDPYVEVVSRLVELINATDYSGIENLLNKEMSKALPLKEATAFFAGVTGQVGKIQKLSDPKRTAEGAVFTAQCERGVLEMSLALDDEKRIAGLNFTPVAASGKAEAI
ncbi:MAG: peptidase, partial [Verrucomicrobiales bacterium]|nr:peptidase [Verrucomicrobiales bacterium]